MVRKKVETMRSVNSNDSVAVSVTGKSYTAEELLDMALRQEQSGKPIRFAPVMMPEAERESVPRAGKARTASGTDAPTGAAPLPRKRRPTKSKQGRPRYTDPTDPKQLWTIACRRGVRCYLWSAPLDSWIEVPKTRIEDAIRELDPDAPVAARLHKDGRDQMLLIG